MYQNLTKDSPVYPYNKEEYFNLNQDNEISDKVNQDGGNEPTRVDHGNVKDFYSVDQTMTKEESGSTDSNTTTPSKENKDEKETNGQ